MSHRRDTPTTVRDKQPRQRPYARVRAKSTTPLADRIKMHSVIDPSTGCWVWQLALVKGTGYGALSVDRRPRRAHRISYEAFIGPIPEGMQLDHLCRNRACVNPDHLEPVTPRENNNRSPLTHGKETHCPHGHAYDKTNTYVTKSNRRHCGTCRVAYQQLYRAMTSEERESRRAAGLPVVDLAAYFAEHDGQVAS